MDGLRNGPYRMCRAASGDVLMCYRGAGTVTAGCIKKRERRGESRNGKDSVSKSKKGIFEFRNPGAPKE